MLIGIKYCGGCNSRYDRVKFVNTLKNKLSSINFCSVEQKKKVDYMVVVCGCSATCASTKGIQTKYGQITINSCNQEKEVIQQIKQLIQKHRLKE